MKLLKYDIFGSIAHAAMLEKIGILDKSEFTKLKRYLLKILKSNEVNDFNIKIEDEDCHTAIENFLIKNLGELGEKIHTARSRNDQVLSAIRLYSKSKLYEIFITSVNLSKTLLELAKKYNLIPIPGYTHTRKAMPSSIGLLFGAYAESLIDSFDLLQAALDLNDQSPLGSASGYGINLNIDRAYTAKLLGFKKVQNNVLYVQNSRGKIESVIIFALSKIMDDLSKISNDIILFTMKEFGFFILPDNFTTGSSLMPNKKNPDLLELIRAKSSRVRSRQIEVDLICKDLPSGYNRDFQLTKGPLLESIEIVLSSLIMMDNLLQNLKIDMKKCINSMDKEIYATDETIDKVKNGSTFRSAYRELGKDISKIKAHNPIDNISLKTHVGATGNLGIEKSLRKIEKINLKIKNEQDEFMNTLNSLLKDDEKTE